MPQQLSLHWQYGSDGSWYNFCLQGQCQLCEGSCNRACCIAGDVNKIVNHYIADSIKCNDAGAHAVAIRTHINKLCSQLAADAGKLALLMCEGFGIPDHLLQAPIAFNWQQIGTGWKQV